MTNETAINTKTDVYDETTNCDNIAAEGRARDYILLGRKCARMLQSVCVSE